MPMPTPPAGVPHLVDRSRSSACMEDLLDRDLRSRSRRSSMQADERLRSTRWGTPAGGVGIGIVYFVAFTVAGHVGYAVFGLALMTAVSGAAVLAARRSETMRGLLDHQ